MPERNRQTQTCAASDAHSRLATAIPAEQEHSVPHPLTVEPHLGTVRTSCWLDPAWRLLFMKNRRKTSTRSAKFQRLGDQAVSRRLPKTLTEMASSVIRVIMPRDPTQ